MRSAGADAHTGLSTSQRYDGSMLAKLERHWHAFADDEPGQRFENQHHRLKRSGKPFLIGLAAAGALLVASGVVLLFIPGPGLLVAAFGLALLAGVSHRLAKVLDRAEPVVRRRAKRAKAWWSRAALGVRIALIAAVVALAAAAAYAAYRLWFS